MLRRACVVCAKVKTRKPPLLQIGNHLVVANSGRVFGRCFASSSDDGDGKKDGKGKKSKVRGFPLPTRHEGGKDDKFINFEADPEKSKIKRSRPDTPKESGKPTIRVVVKENPNKEKSDRPQGEASVGSAAKVPKNSEPPASQESKVKSRRRPDTPKSKVKADTIPDEPVLEAILKLIPDRVEKKVKTESEPEKKAAAKAQLYGIDVLYQEINKTKLKPRPDNPGSKIDAQSKPRIKRSAARDRDVTTPNRSEPTTFVPEKREKEVTTRPRPDNPDEVEREKETKASEPSEKEAEVETESCNDAPPNKMEPSTYLPETEAARLEKQKKVWPAHERVEVEEKTPQPEPEVNERDRQVMIKPRPDTPQNLESEKSASEMDSSTGRAAPELEDGSKKVGYSSETKDESPPARSESLGQTAQTTGVPAPDAKQAIESQDEKAGDLGTNFYCGKTKARAEIDDESDRADQPKNKSETRPRPDTPENLTKNTEVSVQQENNNCTSPDSPLDRIIVRAYSDTESTLNDTDESTLPIKKDFKRSRPEIRDKYQPDEVKPVTLKLNPGPDVHKQPEEQKNSTIETSKAKSSKSSSSLCKAETNILETEQQSIDTNPATKPNLHGSHPEQVESASLENSVKQTEDELAKDEEETSGKSSLIQETSHEKASIESSVDLGENFYDGKTKTEQSFEKKYTREGAADLGVNFYDRKQESSVDKLTDRELAEEEQEADWDPHSRVQSNTVNNSMKTRPRSDTPQSSALNNKEQVSLRSKEKAQSETSVDGVDSNAQEVIHGPKMELILSRQERLISSATRSKTLNVTNITLGKFAKAQSNKKESPVGIGKSDNKENMKVKPNSEENSRQESSVDLGENFYDRKAQTERSLEKQESSVDLGVNFYERKAKNVQSMAEQTKQESSVDRLIKEKTLQERQNQENSISKNRSSSQSEAVKSSMKTRPRPDTPQRSVQEKKKQDSVKSDKKTLSKSSVDDEDDTNKS